MLQCFAIEYTCENTHFVMHGTCNLFRSFRSMFVYMYNTMI